MRCRRPGCAGTVVDGYCDDCGLAPARSGDSGTVVLADAGRRTGAGTSTTGTPTSGSSTGTTGTRVRRLGAGLVELPPAPQRDPLDAVMVEPVVAEHHRYCGECHSPVGRSRDGSPGRTEGFCPKCRTPFRFTAELAPGELVAGQYEIEGCLAHGGLGWVYLARDRNVVDRWVVLKGLLRRDDREAMAAAVAEARFLAEVKHPNIVEIHNFVEHRGARYIVMEFVNGVSLRQTLDARREANGGTPSPLPVEEAIAYVLEILPALGHLHERGLLYCDLKPDNVIRTDGDAPVKLIDLGGVYRAGDTTSPVYGTAGYQAPEIATTGPTVASDIHTAGRTLAVLCTGRLASRSSAPLDPAEEPQLAEFDSLHRVLQRATATDPDDRFESAEAMAEQLLGVLREVVSARTGRPAPGASTLFTAPPPARAGAGGRPWRALPLLTVDPADPGASALIPLAALRPEEALLRLDAIPASRAVALWRARLLIEAGRLDAADDVLAGVAAADPWEWRVHWYRGLVAFERGRPDDARRAIWQVYCTVPGELAPKTALGVAAELADDHAEAVRWYEPVSRTDPAVTIATLGLARCRTALGDREGAIAAYGRVPETSSAHVDAAFAALRLLVPDDGTATLDDVQRAAAIVERLPLPDDQLDGARLPVLRAALRLISTDGHGDAVLLDDRVLLDHHTVLDHRLDETELRTALESTYRSLARRAGAPAERIALVDEANRVRPRTWR